VGTFSNFEDLGPHALNLREPHPIGFGRLACLFYTPLWRAVFAKIQGTAVAPQTTEKYDSDELEQKRHLHIHFLSTTNVFNFHDPIFEQNMGSFTCLSS